MAGGAALVATLAVGLAPATPASAAGVTTHAWMAAQAIDKVASPQLKALLRANADYVRSGAHFPDSGYALSNTYGEEAHWQRFHDAYAAQILEHTECTDLTVTSGPCAQRIAFLMGMIGHGMGDEVWDWLFEPNVADLGEYYTPSDLGGYASEGGAETQMDLSAVADHHQPTTDLVPFPDHPEIIQAFNSVGFTDIDDADLNLGQIAMRVVHQAEASWAPTHIDDMHHAMPWMTANLVHGPGGVEFAAVAIAGEWNAMWGRLLGDQPATSVSITYPADGQRRVPATGWDREHHPGSGRGRGGARTRVAAVLTYSRPYSGSAGTVSSELPAGSMTLVERDSGTPVPLRGGWPRSVPYGPDLGEHMVGIQPAGDLAPCTWYRAGVTDQLVDARNLPVVPHTWEFRTGADAEGHRCSDDPFTPDENVARKALHDLLGLDPLDVESQLHDAGYRWDRGLTRRAYLDGLLRGEDLRTKLVQRAYQADLGRSPDAAGLAYWAGKLTSISLPELHARLLGSPEVFRRAGGTNRGYVAALYQAVHGRSPDPSGAAYWTGRLDRGLSCTGLARLLLTSHESAQRTVTSAYQAFLQRTPDPSGTAHWTAYLERGRDPRDLWGALISSAEFDRKAQAAPTS